MHETQKYLKEIKEVQKKVETKHKRIEEPKIDIIKLMRYTKRGNKKWFQEELKKIK